MPLLLAKHALQSRRPSVWESVMYGHILRVTTVAAVLAFPLALEDSAEARENNPAASKTELGSDVLPEASLDQLRELLHRPGFDQAIVADVNPVVQALGKERRLIAI
jgi:hypothetical protein